MKSFFGTGGSLSSSPIGEAADPAFVKAIPDTIYDITSTTSHVVPAGAGRAKVVLVGKGGDGGDCTDTNGNKYQAGGGGGGGGLTIKVFDVTPGDTIDIDITSGTVTATHTPSSTVMVANPGSDGGSVSEVSAVGSGGSGGTASGGDVNITGGSGSSGAVNGGTSRLAAGAGGSIGGNSGYAVYSTTIPRVTVTGAGTGTTDLFCSIGGTFFFDASSIGSSSAFVFLQANGKSFENSLLYGSVPEKTMYRAFDSASGYGVAGANGLPAFTMGSGGSFVQPSKAGSETGGAAGGLTGSTAQAGANGGSIGAGGSGACQLSQIATTFGGLGGAAHAYIIY